MIWNWLKNLIFPEQINGANRCETYLFRWHLLSLPWCKVYLHRFVADDWSRDMHDHPKRFISIGLWGRYTEWTPAGSRRYSAPWVRTFPAEHIHRLTIDEGRECWTLVIVLAAMRPWGFWHLGQFIPWKKYVTSTLADQMKSCP